MPDEQCRWQRYHDGLRQHAGDEHHQHQEIACHRRCLGEPHPGQESREVEQSGEHVLPLDDPGHRLDVNGVHGEDHRDQPRPGNRQPAHQAPHEKRVDEVQHQVDDVVAEGIETPKLVLQPEGRVDDRPVVAFVADVARREPDVPKPGPCVDHRRVGEDEVVPDESGTERGIVARADEYTKHEQAKRIPARRAGNRKRVPESRCVEIRSRSARADGVVPGPAHGRHVRPLRLCATGPYRSTFRSQRRPYTYPLATR